MTLKRKRSDEPTEKARAPHSTVADPQALVRFLSSEAKIPLLRAMGLATGFIKAGLHSPELIAGSELKDHVQDPNDLKAILKACRAKSRPSKAKANKRSEPFTYDTSAVVDPKLSIKVNRAPYLLVFCYRLLLHTTTLDDPSALSVAQAVTSQSAARKAQSIGLGSAAAATTGLIGTSINSYIPVMGRKIPVLRSEKEESCKAIDTEKLHESEGIPVYDPLTSWQYLSRSFGKDKLSQVIVALDSVFSSYVPDKKRENETEEDGKNEDVEQKTKELDGSAWMMYVRTRPSVSDGVSGWGQKSDLAISSIVKETRSSDTQTDIRELMPSAEAKKEVLSEVESTVKEGTSPDKKGPLEIKKEPSMN